MPDRKRESVVINTGPIIALSLLGQFDLLNDVLTENGFWLKQQLYDWALAEAGE